MRNLVIVIDMMISQPNLHYYEEVGWLWLAFLLLSWIKFFYLSVPSLFSSHWSDFFGSNLFLEVQENNPLFGDFSFYPSRNLGFVAFIQPCGPDSRKPGSPDTSKFQTFLNLVLVATVLENSPQREVGQRVERLQCRKPYNVVRGIFMNEELLRRHRFHTNIYAHRVVW